MNSTFGKSSGGFAYYCLKDLENTALKAFVAPY
jgi:hypothetical protein